LDGCIIALGARENAHDLLDNVLLRTTIGWLQYDMNMNSMILNKVFSQVKILSTPEQYHLATLPTRGDYFLETDADETYWTLIPEYLVNRCPICLQDYYAQVDTYSLASCPKFDNLGRLWCINPKTNTNHPSVVSS